MDYYYKKTNDKYGEGIEITEFKPEASFVTILPEIEGLPVTFISQRALIKATHLTGFLVPCYDGDYSMAKYILGETIIPLQMILETEDGQIELFFPGFYSDSIEDTMARAIHLRIEGSGYAYRECVMKSKVDIESYDRLFSRAKGEDPKMAVDIALCRLSNPFNLKDDSRVEYQTFIEENIPLALTHLIEKRNRSKLSFLLSDFRLKDEEKAFAIKLASTCNDASIVPIVMAGLSK